MSADDAYRSGWNDAARAALAALDDEIGGFTEPGMVAPTTSALEAYAAMEAELHQPEHGGGCTCGFCAWSVEHVVVMSIRDGWSKAAHDRRSEAKP